MIMNVIHIYYFIYVFYLNHPLLMEIGGHPYEDSTAHHEADCG